MNRLFIILLFIIAFAIKSDAAECDWTPIEKDSYGCVDFFWYRKAEEINCSNMPDCFKFQMVDVPQKIEAPKPEPKKEFFVSEVPEEKKKVIPILDSSALALLKNSNLKDIKIIFYNKGNLSKNFAKEAERYLLDKGVKKDQFKIEIR